MPKCGGPWFTSKASLGLYEANKLLQGHFISLDGFDVDMNLVSNVKLGNYDLDQNFKKLKVRLYHKIIEVKCSLSPLIPVKYQVYSQAK
jgi:hypothetical protein